MKYLLLPFLLMTNMYAISIETSEETTLKESEIDEMLKMDQELDAQGAAAIKLLEEQKRAKEEAAQKEQAVKDKKAREAKQEQATKKEPVEKETDSKPLFIIGVGGGSGHGESLLANATDEFYDPFSTNTFLLRAGIVLGSFDFLVQYNGSSALKDEESEADITLGLNSVEGVMKYRVFDFGSGTFQYSPMIGVGFGADNLDTSPDATAGIHYMVTAGLQVFIATNFVLEAAFIYNKTYWNYPIEGIESSFETSGFDLAVEYRF